MSAASPSSLSHMPHTRLVVSSLASPISSQTFAGSARRRLTVSTPRQLLQTLPRVRQLLISVTNFSNPDATGREMSGSVHFTVYTNAQCNYVLTSTYGALKNITAGQTGTFRDYYADAYNISGSGTLVHLNGLSPNTLVSQFTIPAPVWWGASTVAIDFSIPQTSTPLAAGEYQDILSLTINPSI